MDTPKTYHGSSQTITLEGDTLPDRIELIPTGALRLKDQRGLVGQISDPAALIERSMSAATAGILPIDFDHGMDGLGMSDGRAAGWITGLSVEGQRIFANVEWTPAGAEALRGKTYRFISPTFTINDQTREAHLILRAGLTNDPAFSELAQVASNQEEEMPQWLTNLASLLGMEDETDEAKIAAAAETAIGQVRHIDALVTAAGLTGPLTETAATAITAKITAAGSNGEPDPAKFMPISAVTELTAELTAEVASLRKERNEDVSERLVASAMQSGKVPPALEDWAKGYAAKDADGFKTWLASAPVLVSPQPVVPNTIPAKTGTDGLSDDERAVCAATGVSPEAFLATKAGKKPAAAAKED